MAPVWLASDVQPLRTLARLVDQVERGELSGTVLAEKRQIEDRFGLSPLGRRRLAFEIEQAAEPKVPTGERAPMMDGGEPDEDRFLRLVKNARS